MESRKRKGGSLKRENLPRNWAEAFLAKLAPRTTGTGAGADPLGERVPAQAAVQRDDALDDHPAKGNGDALRGGLEVIDTRSAGCGAEHILEVPLDLFFCGQLQYMISQKEKQPMRSLAAFLHPVFRFTPGWPPGRRAGQP